MPLWAEIRPGNGSPRTVSSSQVPRLGLRAFLDHVQSNCILFFLPTIQAFLFASLLIFGHILATSSAPLESVRPLAVVNFLSLIWLAFTVIELADMASATLAPYFELVLGLVFTAAWGACWRDAFLVFSTHTPGLSWRKAAMLSVSYFSILAGLSGLSAQAFGSLMLHLGRNGLHALREGDVLGAKTGQWAVEGGIRLQDEEANGKEACGVEKMDS